MYLKNISKITLTLSLILSGFSLTSTAAEPDESIGTINGQSVTKNQLLTYIQINAPQNNAQDPKIQQRILQSFVGRELLYQEALKRKLDQNELVKKVIEEQRHATISRALAGEILKASPVTEEQLRAVYDKQIAAITQNQKTDGKPKQLPAYEQVRGQINQSIQEKIVSEYVGELFKKAKVELK